MDFYLIVPLVEVTDLTEQDRAAKPNTTRLSGRDTMKRKRPWQGGKSPTTELISFSIASYETQLKRRLIESWHEMGIVVKSSRSESFF